MWQGWMKYSPTPPPAPPVYPAGGDPSPIAPGRPTHHRQQGRHTRPDAGHAAPVCTQYQTGRAGTIRAAARRWTACNVSGKVYNFGRFILSIFIWINFAKSIDNPYIYGYNIISPDKYGLQPQYRYKTGGQNHDEQ